MVRAGEGGYLLDEFLSRGLVAIGWNGIGDLAPLSTSDKIKAALRKDDPEYTDAQININAGQIYRFRNEFKKGDYVVTYDRVKRVYSIGEITSDVEYNPHLFDYHHIRKVKWLQTVQRDNLLPATRNSLGAISTIFELPKEAVADIMANLNQASVVPSSANAIAATAATAETLEIIKEDTIAKAHEFIKDKVLQLNWEQMQELVAGVLRAMGYKTKVSSKGPDRGRDIIASPDGLGFEEPRIFVEVKHRGGAMGAPEIRSFVGGLRGKDRGLYVSTGGFSKEANYEAERASVPITLADADFLVDLIVQYYDQFDTDSKALVPLRKIYWPL
jgi:restriction system protein